MIATESVAHRGVDAVPGAGGTTRAQLTLRRLCGLVVALIGAIIGSMELHDNSFFTHLATGRLLLDRGVGSLWNGMPDPYTFTSGGRSWVVQSWFASLLYAGSDELAGAAGVRLLTAITCAVLALLAWRLSRPGGTLIPRLLVTGFVLVVGASTWTSRPFLFGLVCFALMLLAAEGDLDPRWLVPVGWLWVNTHGSFPLGLVAIAALALGRRLDGEHPTRELIALKWSALGVLAGGVLNPVGPKLLAFPITMLARHDVLGNVAEWKSPDFAATYARVFLLAAVGAIVVLVRRPSYRAALPLGIFLAAGLLATRNVNVAMLALVPGSAAGLHGLGSTDGSEQTTVTRVGVLALAVLTPFVVISACVSGDVDLRGYPVAAIDWMDGRGLLASDVRVAEEDFVGNLLELRYGPDASAFIDDRYELHDRALVADYRTLTDGTPGWSEVLDRREIDVVLWRRDSPLGALLLVSADWRIAFDDTTADIPAGPNAAELQKMAERKPFVVACRPTVTACFGA